MAAAKIAVDTNTGIPTILRHGAKTADFTIIGVLISPTLHAVCRCAGQTTCGIATVKATAVAEQVENETLKTTLTEIRDLVNEGSPLFKALGISAIIFALAGGLSLALPMLPQMVVVILTITTLAILASMIVTVLPCFISSFFEKLVYVQ